MSDNVIQDGSGNSYRLKVGSDNRLWAYVIDEPVGSERSLAGALYGFGTGDVSATSSMSNGVVLWGRNDDPDHLWQVDKIIYGWNGGNTNFNRTCFCLISYQVGVPTTNNTSITAAIENISKSGPTAAVTDSKFTGHKWDGVDAGMTGGSGGYGQISNRIAQGDTSLTGIAGQIVLGQNDTIQIGITPEESGKFNAAIVYWKIPIAGRT